MLKDVSNTKKGISRGGKFGIWLSCLIPSGLVFVYIVFELVLVEPVYAAVFNIASGDVAGLINAINIANSNGQDNTINLAAGTYTPTAVDNDIDGDNGLPSITGNITIKGAGADTTIIGASSVGSLGFRIFHIASTGNLTLDELTISGGSVSTGGEAFNNEPHGGGILNNGGKLNINNCNISGNEEDFGVGGGISNSNGGTVTINNTAISRNLAGLSDCGGIYNEGPMTISNSIIDENLADAVVGGICTSSIMTINHSTISFNSSAGVLGGISNGGNLTIIDSTIANNASIGSVFNDVGKLVALTMPETLVWELSLITQPQATGIFPCFLIAKRLMRGIILCA